MTPCILFQECKIGLTFENQCKLCFMRKLEKKLKVIWSLDTEKKHLTKSTQHSKCNSHQNRKKRFFSTQEKAPTETEYILYIRKIFETRQRCQFSLLLFNITLKVPTSR